MSRILWILSVFLLALHCSEEKPVLSQDNRPVLPKEGVSSSGEKMEVPSIFTKPKDEYFYNPIGKRDPFREYAGELVKELGLPRSPLERYDLEELSLKGIVWGLSDPRGLLQAPDGYSYIIRSNTRVGKNRGRVSRITRRQVFVEEEYRDPTGKLVVRETVFEIRPDEKNKIDQRRFADE